MHNHIWIPVDVIPNFTFIKTTRKHINQIKVNYIRQYYYHHTINIQIAKMIHKLTFKHNYKILSDHWPLKAMPYYQKPQKYHVNKPRPNYKLNKNIQPHEPEPMQQL